VLLGEQGLPLHDASLGFRAQNKGQLAQSDQLPLAWPRPPPSNISIAADCYLGGQAMLPQPSCLSFVCQNVRCCAKADPIWLHDA